MKGRNKSLQAQRGNPWPRLAGIAAACMTFDDGYADNFHVALPMCLDSVKTGFPRGVDKTRCWSIA
jgi:hypothetical protein